MTSKSSCSGRWRRRVESPHDDHRTTSHGKRLEALTDVLLKLRSSRLLVVSSRLLCSNSNVELHCSLEDDSPARNSRADANCTVNSCARSILARTRLFRRTGDLVTLAPPKHCAAAQTQVQCQTAANKNIHVHTKKLTEI